MNPQIFKELAYDLGEEKCFLPGGSLYGHWVDSPAHLVKNCLPEEYYDFFCEMFEPQKGERNYWWGNLEYNQPSDCFYVYGQITLDNHIQKYLLPNPKSHYSQLIMALLFCSEMCS